MVSALNHPMPLSGVLYVATHNVNNHLLLRLYIYSSSIIILLWLSTGLQQILPAAYSRTYNILFIVNSNSSVFMSHDVAIKSVIIINTCSDSPPT